MHKRWHQLLPRGLVWIVAFKTIGGCEGLPPMRVNQLGILRIMTILAQSRGVLLQLEIKLPLTSFARLMNGMAGVATLI